MGRPKQLLPLPDQPAIRVCVQNILAAGVEDVVVVLRGQDEDAVRAALSDLPVTVVRNPDTLSDMAGSARLGIRAVSPAASGLLICLADHPLVAPETLHTLIAAHWERPDYIIIPLYRGRRGHPTLFPFAVIAGIASGGTLRELIARHHDKVRTLDVPDEGVVLDMDTEEDYQRILRVLTER